MTREAKSSSLHSIVLKESLKVIEKRNLWTMTTNLVSQTKKKKIKVLIATFALIMPMSQWWHRVGTCIAGSVYMNGCSKHTKTKMCAPFAGVGSRKKSWYPCLPKEMMRTLGRVIRRMVVIYPKDQKLSEVSLSRILITNKMMKAWALVLIASAAYLDQAEVHMDTVGEVTGTTIQYIMVEGEY